MYTPPAYSEQDPATLHAFMRAHSFASLITWSGTQVNVTHLPFLLDVSADGAAVLHTHLARANPQMQDLRGGADVLVVFEGPHAFISPSWYRNQLTFPTWNYTAVHARGAPWLIESPEDVHALLERTVALYDTPLGGAWTLPGVPGELTLSRRSAIVGVEIPVTSLVGKMKLNQDKTVEDRKGVIAALEAIGEPDGIAVARMMRDHPDLVECTGDSHGANLRESRSTN
jgi:transcriptional regulator